MREILVDFDDTYDHALAFAIVPLSDTTCQGASVICVDSDGRKKQGVVKRVVPAKFTLDSTILSIELI